MCFDNTSRSLVNKHCSLKNKIEGLKNLIFFVLISQIEQDKQENMIKIDFQKLCGREQFLGVPCV